MARRVSFSFHYQKDIWRVTQIRNSRVTRDWETDKFFDSASWESIQRKSEAAVTAWIDRQNSGTGVTVVLIGAEAADRRFVLYEVEQSHKRGNGLLGIHIRRLKDQHGETSRKGRNPSNDNTVEVEQTVLLSTNKVRKRLSEIYPTYDWVEHDGYQNINRWIEEEAKKAGR